MNDVEFEQQKIRIADGNAMGGSEDMMQRTGSNSKKSASRIETDVYSDT